MKSRLLCLLSSLVAPLCAQFSYPTAIADARAETYRTIDATALKLWIFGETDPATPKPAIVFFFGGGWSRGSPEQFAPQARHFARRGMIAITADYRVRSRHGVPAVECVKDAKAALAWVRTHARRLGIDPDRIAAAGGSAGGHLAARTATVLNPVRADAPDALILFNPVCALAAIEGWPGPGDNPALGPERLGVEPVALSPAHHIGAHVPPTLILHGKADTTVPYASAAAFERAMHKAGKRCRLIGYDGAEHGFFNQGEGYQKTLAAADDFLVELGWLKK